MRNVSLIAAIAVLATAATALAGGYPHPEPDALAKASPGSRCLGAGTVGGA